MKTSLAPKRIRLAYAVHSLNLGGAEQLATQMSQTFAGEFDVSVVCLDEPGLWADRLRKDGIPVCCLWRQPGLDVSVAFRLAAYCRKYGIDIIHAHQSTPWFYAGLSRFRNWTPRLLFEEHGRHFPEKKKKLKNMFNKFLIKPMTHRVVAVSEDVRRRLVEFEGLTFNQIEVVYNGVTPGNTIPGQQRARARKELEMGPDDFVIGTVGRFDPVKNLPLLLKCLKKVRKKASNIRGLLVGDGPCFAEIKRLADSQGLSDFIAMPGYRDDVRRLIQCFDLFVLCSVSEGTSMALLEAMAAGVPVVVTEVGGNPEIVIDGETGWVVPSNSAEKLSRAILSAVSQPDKAKQYAQAGKLRFEKTFTFEKMIENYRGIYNGMVDTQPQ